MRRLLAVLFFSTSLFAQRSIENYLGQQVASREAIVRFRQSPNTASLSQLQQLTDAEETRALDATNTVLLVRSRSNGVGALLRAAAAHPELAFAEPNYVVHRHNTPNDTYTNLLWGMQATGALAAWDLTTGSTANVAGVIDTGIDDTHPDLAANVWSAPAAFSVTIGTRTVTCPAGSHGYNAIARTCSPQDDNSHGSHVAGTIAATGNNSLGVAGMNWTGRMMALKFLDSNGDGFTSDAIDAIEFAIQVKAKFANTATPVNVRVLSASWGGPGYSQALLNEINRANANDILFVTAAGNDGQNNDVFGQYPANFNTPNLIAVAATDSADQLAYFSNYSGSKVHLSAPGVNILSTVVGGSYAYYSGTSMATPHVSGAALLLLSRCNLNTAALRAALLNNVDVVSGLSGKVATGGRLNVNKALRSCAAPADFDLSAAASTLSLTAGNSTTTSLSVTARNGFFGAVGFSVAGLPAGMTASFNPATIAGAGSTILTLASSGSTVAGNYPLTVTASSGALTHSLPLSLTVTAAPPPPSGGSSVTWTNLYNVTATGNGSAQQTGGCNGCPAGALSQQTIPSGEGYLEFTIPDTNTNRVVGLLSGPMTYQLGSLQWALWIWGGVEVRESGQYRAETNYRAGDVFRIAVTGGKVVYSKNGTVFYSSNVAPSYPLQAGFIPLQVGATISNALLQTGSGGTTPPTSTQPVTWANLYNVTPTGNGSAQQSSGCPGCPAGALSQQTISSGSGYVEFTASANRNWVAGLTTGPFDYTKSTVRWALWLWGGVEVRESGQYRAETTYQPGDVFRIAIVNGQVVYSKNGVPFYTSAAPPAYPLQAAFVPLDLGAMITSAVISGQ